MILTDPSGTDTPPIKWCIIGSKGCGKTRLIQRVFSSKEFKASFREDNIHIFSPTIAFERAYDDLKDAHKYSLVDYGTIRRIVDSQLLSLKSTDTTGLPHILIVFDDCVRGTSVNTDFVKALDEIIMGGKHLNISSITTFQSIEQVRGPIRTEFDHFLMFKQSDNEAHDFLRRFTDEKDHNAKVADMKKAWSVPYSFIRVARN
jgi:hypothetical protein